MDEYIEWLTGWVKAYRERLAPGGLLYVYGYPEYLCRLAALFGPDEQRWLQWHYYNKVTPQYRFWQRSHESILALWREGEPTPNIEVDAVRLQYHPSNIRQLGLEVKPTPGGRFGNKGWTPKQHPSGKLPLDTLLEPIVNSGVKQKEGWYMCDDCDLVMRHAEFAAHHRDHAVWSHPTAKPMNLTRRLVLSLFGSGNTDGVCCVPFAGSGSELEVLNGYGVRWVASELEEPYIRLIVERLAQTKPAPQLV